MKNVDKARYFIKKAAVHSYLRSMLRNIKLEKIAQAQPVSGYLSGKEYQRIVRDNKFNGSSVSDLNSWKMQQMRSMRDAVKAKQLQTQPTQQGNTAENSIRAQPLGGERDALTTLDDNLAQADRQISEAAQQAQQRIRTVQKPDSTQGRYAQRPQPPQFNQRPQPPQFSSNRSPIRRGNQGGTSWR